MCTERQVGLVGPEGHCGDFGFDPEMGVFGGGAQGAAAPRAGQRRPASFRPLSCSAGARVLCTARPEGEGKLCSLRNQTVHTQRPRCAGRLQLLLGLTSQDRTVAHRDPGDSRRLTQEGQRAHLRQEALPGPLSSILIASPSLLPATLLCLPGPRSPGVCPPPTDPSAGAVCPAPHPKGSPLQQSQCSREPRIVGSGGPYGDGGESFALGSWAALCELELYDRVMPERQTDTKDMSLNSTVGCDEAVCEARWSLARIVRCLSVFM
ncbi:uncharacterized protein LOC130851169 [Hippopotamus amphibius kiboko]|uniref:uncharacterized protein LOC130851169 n=1 Tax=Hippopotamus amphibius kiboko TaxID=575201 RepID=UPI00259A95C7|nr:uncharacterized protein LOC130851169 [Hippopotamus amphibius kiboko]